MSTDRPDDSFAALFEQSTSTLRRKPPKVGEILEATVVQVGRDAVFVELDGKRQAYLEGEEARGEDGTITIKVGESIRARVIDVDPTTGNVRLGRPSQRRVVRNDAPARDATEKPAAADGAPSEEAVKPAAVVSSLALGTIVHGVVSRIETYGVFVQVDGTKGRGGRGLIPNAELGVPRGTDVRKAFPEGTKVTAKVVDATDGRMRLSIRGAREDAERAEFEGYRDTASAPATLGTFGDLLKKRGEKRR